MKHVMLDIETLSTGDRPHPLQIAWVAFDPESHLEQFTSRRSFYVADDLTKKGFDVDIRTVLWWLGQKEAARQRVIDGIAGRLPNSPSLPLKEILSVFAIDIGPTDKLYVRGVDNIWLASYYAAFDLPIPFNFRNVVEIRSLIDALLPNGEKPPDVGTSHDALDDCLFQIDHLGMAMRYLRELRALADTVDAGASIATPIVECGPDTLDIWLGLRCQTDSTFRDRLLAAVERFDKGTAFPLNLRFLD